MSNRTTRTACIALGIVVCCVVGLPNLYDKFLIARFVAVAAGLAILFLFALIGKKRWRIPDTPVFYIYLLFTLFCGCSILWATNTAEAIFAFSTQLLTPLIIIVIFSLLSTNRHVTQNALWVSAAIIFAVYLFFAVIQLFHVESFSFEQLYRVSGINGHKNLLAIMLFVLSAFLLTAFSIFESKVLKGCSVFLFVVAIVVIILLKSRAVLLGLIVGASFFGIMMIVRTRQCKNSNNARRVNNGYRLTLVVSIILVYAFLTIGLRWFADRSVPHTSEKSEIEHHILSTSSLVERCLLFPASRSHEPQHQDRCRHRLLQFHLPSPFLHVQNHCG